MKKNFFLHMGPHKTGSTYIQKTLFDNQDTIRKAGIDYSKVMKEGHNAHHELAEKLYAKQYDTAEKLLEEIKSSDSDIFLSSENFDRLDIEDIRFLAQSINEYQVEIIFFKRRLDDLLISSWQESIKHGEVESWVQFSFNHLLRPLSSEILNNTKLIEKYEIIFGRNNIKIIDFDTAKLERKDICDLIFDAIDKKELKGITSGVLINESMSYSDVEIIRILNVIYRQKNHLHPHHFLRNIYTEGLQNSAVRTLVVELKKIVEQNLTLVSLSDTFMFDYLNKDFQNKYKDIIINNSFSDEKIVNKKYELPDENWCLESKVIEKIELLYKALNVKI